MKQFLFLLLCSIFFVTNGFAQKKVRFSAETGVSFSQIPDFSSTKNEKTYYLPLASPVLGLASHVALGKRFSLSTGFQYQQRGSVVTQNVELPNAIGGPFSSSFYARARFHEMAIPINLTAHFKIKALKFNAIIGFRRVWNFSGYYTQSDEETSNNVQTSKNEVSGNPFDATKFKTFNPKAFNQITLGLSFPIKSKFEITSALHYSLLSYGIEEKPVGQIPGLDYHNYYHYVSCSDFQITGRYYLK